ncbi:ABC transporter ATP-binding protein [Bacillus sp. TS-2]|nr:ABC transporter ATP-binding protein [Bacillus sp. TS-2]
MNLQIKKINNLKWKTPIADYVTAIGYALYIEGKGYLAFKQDNKEIPYTPIGGKKALQSIIDSGGLLNYKDVIWINPITTKSIDKKERSQLKKFNQIRILAQTISNPLFQKEYNAIMLPLLERFKRYGEEADNSIVIRDELNNFIDWMYTKAKSFQYVPFVRGKRNNEKLYSDHNKLYKLEKLCEELKRSDSHV